MPNGKNNISKVNVASYLQEVPDGDSPGAEFGRRIIAIYNGEPETIDMLKYQDKLDDFHRRNGINEDRFIRNILGISVIDAVDEEIRQFDTEQALLPDDRELPVPPKVKFAEITAQVFTVMNLL